MIPSDTAIIPNDKDQTCDASRRIKLLDLLNLICVTASQWHLSQINIFLFQRFLKVLQNKKLS